MIASIARWLPSKRRAKNIGRRTAMRAGYFRSILDAEPMSANTCGQLILQRFRNPVEPLVYSCDLILQGVDLWTHC
jgi:hypothetical protein